MTEPQIPWPFTAIPVEMDSYGLDPYAYRVLAHVIRRRKCYASLKSIAALCGMSVRQVQHSLKTLESCGMVKKRERRGRTNFYTLNPPAQWKQPDYSTPLEKASAQDYFNRAILRRERNDLEGALTDFRRSLELYEQELSEAVQQGKKASRKKQDIRDVKNEISRLMEREGFESTLDAATQDWIWSLKLVNSDLDDSVDDDGEFEGTA